MSDDSNLLVSVGNQGNESEKSLEEMGGVDEDQYEATMAVSSTREFLGGLCVFQHRGASHCEFYQKRHALARSEDPLDHHMGAVAVAMRFWKPRLQRMDKRRMALLTQSQGLLSALHPAAQETRRYRAHLEAQSGFSVVLDLRNCPADHPLLQAADILSKGANGTQDMYRFYSAVEKMLPECKFKDVSDAVDVRDTFRTWRLLRRKFFWAALGLGLLLMVVLIVYGFTH